MGLCLGETGMEVLERRCPEATSLMTPAQLSPGDDDHHVVLSDSAALVTDILEGPGCVAPLCLLPASSPRGTRSPALSQPQAPGPKQASPTLLAPSHLFFPGVKAPAAPLLLRVLPHSFLTILGDSPESPPAVSAPVYSGVSDFHRKPSPACTADGQ